MQRLPLYSQVDFVASAESPPVELLHALKLYREGDGSGQQPQGAEASVPAESPPVVRDRYDEFVFVSPPVAFYDMLKHHVRVDASCERSDPALRVLEAHSDADELWRIATARSAVAQNIAKLREAA